MFGLAKAAGEVLDLLVERALLCLSCLVVGSEAGLPLRWDVRTKRVLGVALSGRSGVQAR